MSTPPAELLPVLTAVWPGTNLRLGTSRRSDFRVLPSWDSPRLFIPSDMPAVAARSFTDFNACMSVSEVLKRLTAAVGSRLGATRRVGDGLQVGGDAELENVISDILGRRVRIIVGIGTQRANRKPVVRAVSPKGELLAIAKIGTNRLTDDLVQAEFAALTELANRTWEHLRVPQALALLDWYGHPVLLMSAVPARPSTPRTRFKPPLAAMRELSLAFSEPAVQLPESPFAQFQQERLMGLEGFDAEATRQLVETALAAVWDIPVPLGAWHGDFTPWNMAYVGERVSVWDWEQFHRNVPLGLDALHFAVNVSTYRRGVTSETVREGLLSASTVEADPTMAYAIRVAYLIDICTRYAIGVTRTQEPQLTATAAVMRGLLEELVARGAR